MSQQRIAWCFTPFRAGVAVLYLAIAVAGCFWPAWTLARSIFDPALSGPGIPRLARQLHQALTPRYARWASQRLASGQAAGLSVSNVSGTEWPLYGSVFYLRAEEALQSAWERDHSIFPQEPRLFARDAIEAAARLVADPGQAAWVKKYWGDAYLQKEDVFYRMLVISALASHRRLTGSDEFLPLLRSQTDGLANELAASRFGLLDDYPAQCFPTDIVSAWEAIARADTVLQTDHSAQLAAGVRGFTGAQAGSLGLPPYFADARSGKPSDRSRGCSNSNICALAPTLWPETARDWYSRYEANFWQQDWLSAGFREFPRGAAGGEWYNDVDSGPVIRGNGFAACAFGIGAARRNGRFDQAYLLSLEMVAMSWPLPGSRLLVPRLVSNSTDAPFLGEAAILLQLATQPISTVQRTPTGPLPFLIFLGLGLYTGAGALLVRRAIHIVRPRPKR